MKKIKLRLKRALFAFFHDEILKAVGYQLPYKNVEIKQEYLNVDRLDATILLDYEPVRGEYQHAVERAKKMLFKEVLKYIVVDAKSIINPEVSYKKGIRVSLFVGRKNID